MAVYALMLGYLEVFNLTVVGQQGFMALFARNLLMFAIQLEASFVMVKARTIPALGTMAFGAVGRSISCKLSPVYVTVAGSALATQAAKSLSNRAGASIKMTCRTTRLRMFAAEAVPS